MEMWEKVSPIIVMGIGVALILMFVLPRPWLADILNVIF